MIDWLRTRSLLLRYLLILSGMVLMILVAAGVGATAALVVGRQTGGVATGGADHSPMESTTRGGVETTGSANTSEGTALESSTESTASVNMADKTSFVHRATDENSRGDYTYISDPNINGHPYAIVFALPTREDTGSATSYKHNIGVWYASGAHKWAIFNQDRAPVPAGTSFEVVVPQASSAFVHEAGISNTAGNYTYLDNRLTNGKPDAVLTVTQNWNPGGGRGVYNDHPVGVLYDAKVEKWAVYNRDGTSIPKGAVFNIGVSAGADKPAR